MTRHENSEIHTEDVAVLVFPPLLPACSLFASLQALLRRGVIRASVPFSIDSMTISEHNLVVMFLQSNDPALKCAHDKAGVTQLLSACAYT